MSEETERLIARHLDGTASADESRHVDERVRTDPAFRRALFLAAAQDTAIRDLLAERAGVAPAAVPPARRRPVATRPLAAAAAILLVGALAILVIRAARPAEPLGEVVEVSAPAPGGAGPALAGPSGSAPLRPGLPFRAGDRIETGDTRVALAYADDGTRLDLEPGSVVEPGLEGGAKRVRLPRGALRAEVARQPAGRPMAFVTPHAVATVLGTRLALAADPDATRLEVTEGKVRLARPSGGESVEVAAGRRAEAVPGAPLVARPLRAEFDCAAVDGDDSGHDGAVAVPAPAGVKVDGDLGDWDLSGASERAYDEALRPKFVFRHALMHDAKALYVGAHVADDTPLLNHHDPAVEPNLGWAGDALQVRLCSDPDAPYPVTASKSDRLCHLTMWFYTDKRLPVLHVQYGMDFHGTKVWTGEDAGVAFQPDKGGGGYTLEARIPWERLNAGARPPKAGESLAIVLQPLWSDGTGWKHALTFCDIVRAPGFAFQDPATWGRVLLGARGNLARQDRPKSEEERLRPLTLRLPPADPPSRSRSAAVFDGGGRLVRTLPVQTASDPAAKLPDETSWDGLDDRGRPLPAGPYTVKTLTTRGIGQRYVASLHNAGTPPWVTDDGRGSWGGDHAAPIAAAADAERVYLGWGFSEAGWALIAVDPKPATATSARKLWGQHQVLEIGMGVTAMAADGERLFVGQDGKSWDDRENPQARDRAGVVLWDARTGRPLNFPFGKRFIETGAWDARGKDGPSLRGLAVSGDALAISLYHENKVLLYDWKTGKRTGEFAVEKPAGLAFEPDRRLLVAAGRRVARIDPASGKVETAIDGGFADPWGLAVAKGTVYVADRGGAMQVKVFRDGKPAGTIGKAGGRPRIGRYDPQGILNPAGIAADREGKVWVTEYDNTPRRVSVWNGGGRLAADLLGPGSYAVDGQADPASPRLVNTHDTLFEVDYRTGASKTLATLVRQEPGEIGMGGDYMGRSLLMRHAKGRDYLVRRGHHLAVVYLLGKDLVARPVAAAGWLKDAPLYGVSEALVGKPAFDNRYAQIFRWADRNGDGKMQAGEIDCGSPKAAPWGSYWGSFVDEDLTIWTVNREGKAVWRIPVKEWLPDGTPVYPAPADQAPLFALPDTAELHDVMPGKGGVYVLENETPNAGNSGAGGMISLCGPDGTRRWAYRRVWTGFGLGSPLSQPGDVCGAMRFIGTAALDGGLELVAVNCYCGYFAVLCDRGLWVASLCRDNRYGPKADETTVWPENFSGQLFRNREDGKVYLIAGDSDCRIWEVTGLEHLRTAEAAFEITPADREKAVAASLRRQGVAAGRPPLRVRRAAAVAVDGRLDEWAAGDAAAIDAGGGRSAKAWLAYDEAHLYAAFEVADDSPMRNGGADPALLFKTGDACDVMLGADPGAPPDRRQPAKGDLRLLFSVMDGKPLAVLHEPVARGGEKAPRVFSSPTGAVAFDRVLVLPGARVAVERAASGYALEASVPLADLGFAPRPGLFTRGDAGVIFSDPGGSRDVLRAYYANRDTAIVNDIPSEARLEPHRWGAVEVAP